MRETGTLNREVSDIPSTLGHTDELIVCDAGFTIPLGVRCADISLAVNKPTVLEVLEELQQHFSVEELVMAGEARQVNPTRFAAIVGLFGKDIPVACVPHAELRRRAQSVRAIIRTGDLMCGESPS